MYSETFRGLNKLTTVYLKYNVCIDEDFNNLTEIATLQQVVDEKCGFIKEEVTTTMPSTTTQQSTASFTQPGAII